MLVDSNCEYEFHPEIYSFLLSVLIKSIFNSLLLVFLKYLLHIQKDIFRDFGKKTLIQDIDTILESQCSQGF